MSLNQRNPVQLEPGDPPLRRGKQAEAPRRRGRRPKGAVAVTVSPVNPAVRPFGYPESSGYIRLRIREVAVQRGCVVMYGEHRGEANLSAISRGAGLAWTTVQTLANNGSNIAGVKLETIARLCAFFQCSVGEIMEYVPYVGERPPQVAPAIRDFCHDPVEQEEVVPFRPGFPKW